MSWDSAVATSLAPSGLGKAPSAGARFAPLPDPFSRSGSYAGWSREFAAWLQRSQSLDLMRSPGIREVSKPNESERDSRATQQRGASSATRRSMRSSGSTPRRSDARGSIRRASSPSRAKEQQRRPRSDGDLGRRRSLDALRPALDRGGDDRPGDDGRGRRPVGAADVAARETVGRSGRACANLGPARSEPRAPRSGDRNVRVHHPQASEEGCHSPPRGTPLERVTANKEGPGVRRLFDTVP
jgi:hypothetical protein